MILFQMVTAQYNLPPGLLLSVCTVESGLRADAIHRDDGSEHSVGLCQLHTNTARLMGFRGKAKDLYDPKVNLLYASKYLRHQLNRYGGSITKALAAYNAGTCRINDKGEIKNRQYVNKVMKTWKSGS